MTQSARAVRSRVVGAFLLTVFVSAIVFGTPAKAHDAFLVPLATVFGMAGKQTLDDAIASHPPGDRPADGSMPAISSVPVLLAAGARQSNVTIATVSDAANAADTLIITINGGLSATGNGVTVTNIRIDDTGAVTADVIAAEGSTDVMFELTVSNPLGESSTAVLSMFVPSICPGPGTWSQQAHPTGPFSTYGFGQSVAISGDAAVVGAPGGGTDRGFAHIFVRSGSVWTEQLRINPSDSEHGDHFGVSVAIDHDTIIVGASLDDNSGVDAGSAYVFVRSGTTWTQQQKLTASDGAASDEFGHSVAISGESVIVGALSEDNAAGANAGSAYVFTRSGTVWSQQQKIVASDGAAGDTFGVSSAISGETVIIGAQADDDAGSGSGSAYVFTRSGALWSQQQKLTASDGAANDAFGNSVSIGGDTVVVGASTDDNAPGSDAGAAFIFTRSGAVWSQQQKLTASDGAVSDRFGFSVAISDETVIVGADADDNAGGTNAGGGYIFRRYGDFWAEEQKLTGSVTDSTRFGSSVAIDGDTINVGAPFEDAPGGLTDAGAAYFFIRSCRPIISTLPVVRSPGGGISNSTIGNIADGEQAPDTLSVIVNGGASATQNAVTVNSIGISPSGIVTADVVAAGGAADASFTLTVIDGSGLSSRATLAVIVLSQCPSTGGWSQQAQPTPSDGAATDNFGISVAVSGDTVIVGAQGDDNAGGADAGAVYVFVRNGTVWAQQQKLTASDGAANDRFGDNIAISGNTVIVGAYLDSNAVGTNAGGAYVFIRNGTVWTQQQKLTASDGAAGDQFGVSVTVSGDTAVVGAWTDDNALGTDAGAAYVFTRSGSVWTQQQKLTAPDGAASDNFGYAASLSGDTVILSAFGDDTAGGTDTGSVYVFTRNGTVWSSQQKLTASNGASNDLFGVSIVLSGDTAIVGAPLDDTAAGVDAGSAYVFARSGSVWSQQQNLTSSDAAAGDRFARSVSISGDTVIVGADSDDNAGGTDAGSSYIFMRSGGVWSQLQKLTASNGAATDNFGFASAISGDTAIVGSFVDDTAAGTDAGSSYIFAKICGPSIGTVPVLRTAGAGVTNSVIASVNDEQTLNTLTVTANGGASATVNGVTVNNISVNGSGAVTADVVAAVGAADASFTLTVTDSAGLSATATLPVVVLSPCPGTGTWNEQAHAVAQSGSNNEQFGDSVAISGDTVIVGVQFDDTTGGTNAGTAYVFTRSGTVWSLQQILTASDGTANDRFGSSVAISGNTLIVGASSDESAYVFTRSGIFWSQQQKLTNPAPGFFDAFGFQVAVSGDTVVVGAVTDDGVVQHTGSAFLFARNGTVWTLQQKLTAFDGKDNDGFSQSVSISGDTVMIGTLNGDFNPNDAAGAAYIFLRIGTVWELQQKLLASDAAAQDSFGESSSISGDTVVVGAANDDNAAGSNAGAAYIFTRSGGVWTQQQKLTASDAAASAAFGGSVSISGDTVIIGAEGANGAVGNAYIFTRTGTVWTEKQKLTASDAAAPDQFGTAAAISGDTAIIGAVFDDTSGGTDAGSAYIFNKVCPAPTATSTPTNTATSTPTFTPTNTPTSTPTATPAGTPAISGTITYGNAISGPTPPRFISNVTVSGAGSPNVSTATAAPGATAGQYSLTGFGAGAYTITPTKTGGVNNITSFDAAKIAQHVSGISFLTGNALVVADVSGNGSVTSFDAANIANFVVVASPAGSTGTWRFYTIPNVPFPPGATATSRTYPSVTISIAGEDYTGLLMGEVSGNWNNTGARLVGSRQLQSAVGGDNDGGSSGPEKSVAVRAPLLVTPADSEILIPVRVEGVADKGIISYEFDLRYDPSVIQPQPKPVDLVGTVSSKLSVAVGAEEAGLLKIAVYGPTPIDGSGVLLNLRFTAVGAPGSVSPLVWESMMFNEGWPQTTVSNGEVKISAAAYEAEIGPGAINWRWTQTENGCQ